MRPGFWIFFLITICFGCSDKYLTPVYKSNLETGWQFTQVGKNYWKPAEVPGSVHTDLQRQNLIPDPLRESREDELRWIAESDWEYKTEFFVNDSLLRYKYLDIIFKGLDTYATVLLNDSVFFYADNMFREWRKDCKKYVKPGTNELKVRFYSPYRRAQEEASKVSYRLPGGNDAGTSMFVRKAAYQFGWDFAPTLTTSGIWQKVVVSAHDGVYLASMHVKTLEAADTSAWLSAEVEIQADAEYGNAVVTIRDSFRQFMLAKGRNIIQVRFRIDHPELWWPNGMGKANLYSLTARLYVNNYLVDTLAQKTGIRTIELKQDDDEWGKSFYFRINNIPVFMMGANVVPQSMFPGSVTAAQTKRLVNEAAEAGMNMLRVWGGGVYESDLFYNLCDEKGILVWQDFMFAGSMYPVDSAFQSSVKAEIRDQVTRLRSHPCIALWCGNNEIEVAWNNWGWQKQFNLSPEDSATIIGGYHSLFDEKLPQMLSELDGTRPYIPSSPQSNWGKHENFLQGNMHYWGVWHGEDPIDSFSVFVPRFMTEYGMQSLPSFINLQSATDSSRITLSSSFLKNRQKSYKGNSFLMRYIENKYTAVRNTEELCYLSQIHQAESMRLAIESHRKLARQCMGSLYWQLNNVWDGVSWSTLEYNGDRKPAHYNLKRLYARDILIAESVNDTARIFLQSNSLEGVKGTVEIKVMDLRGRVLGTYLYEASVGYLVASKVFEEPVSKLLHGQQAESCVLRAVFTAADGSSISTTHYFVNPGKLKLLSAEIKMELEKIGEGTRISLFSDVLVKDLVLQAKTGSPTFSDNGFDLMPGETKTVMVTGNQTIEPDQIEIWSLNKIISARNENR